MKFEKLMEEWGKDAEIEHDLHAESLKISKLHEKYYRFFLAEKNTYFKMLEDHKKLKLDKWEFLTMGPTKETSHLDWRLPPQGRILKAEVQQYIEADPDISKSMINMSMQKEKCDYIDSIIKTLSQRSFNIRTALEYLKFQNGER